MEIEMNVQPQVIERQLIAQSGAFGASNGTEQRPSWLADPVFDRGVLVSEYTATTDASRAPAVSLALSSSSSTYDVLAEVAVAGRVGMPLLVDLASVRQPIDDSDSHEPNRAATLQAIERLYAASARGSAVDGIPPMIVISEGDLADAARLGNVEKYVRVGSGQCAMGESLAHPQPVLELLGTEVSGIIYGEGSVVRDGCGGVFGTSSELVDASEMVAGSVINLCDYLADTPRENDWFDSKRLEEQIRLAVRELDSMHDVKETLGCLGQPGLGRRIGIGISGVAFALQQLGVAGNADKARAALAQVTRIVRDEAYRSSCDLAEEFGASPWFDSGEFHSGTVADQLPPELVERIRMYGLRNAQIFGWALMADQPAFAMSVGVTSDWAVDAVRTAEGVGQQIAWHQEISEGFGTKYLAEVLIPDSWSLEQSVNLTALREKADLWGIAVR
jgi:ribonucleoside-diphosphate reductase alpha chain